MHTRRVVSIKDVAARAGVSTATVSNVVNRPEIVSEERRERVEKAIRALGYVRNESARQLKMGKSRTIGAIVLDSSNPFYADLLLGAADEAENSGLALLQGSSGQSAKREEMYLSLFDEQRVRGIILASRRGMETTVDAISKSGLPIVLIDADASDVGVCSVSTDDIAGGRLAVRHLLDSGRRRIAVMTADDELRQVKDRWAGAVEAVASQEGATIEQIDASSPSVLAGRAAAARILDRPEHERPDGIFCVNDLLAVGALQALSNGVRDLVPDPIGLIGYDDIAFAASSIVPLSSIARPADHIGRTAVQLLEEEISQGDAHRHRHVMFRPELVERQSTIPLL